MDTNKNDGMEGIILLGHSKKNDLENAIKIYNENGVGAYLSNSKKNNRYVVRVNRKEYEENKKHIDKITKSKLPPLPFDDGTFPDSETQPQYKKGGLIDWLNEKLF